MNAEKQSNGRQVTFRRIGGRIVPISVSAAGSAVAFDAARTTRVLASKSLIIDRKKFAFQPFLGIKFGDQLVARNPKTGATMGQARYYVEKKFREGGFSWLSVKRPFRNQGLSKKLARQGAIEMKSQGAKNLVAHVVHPGSLLSQFNRKNDSLWLEVAERKTGATYQKITKADAIKRVSRWQRRRTSSTLWDDAIDFLRGTKKNKVLPVIRETVLPKGLRRRMAPFRTNTNKALLALGIGAAVGGVAYLAYTFRKPEKNHG